MDAAIILSPLEQEYLLRAIESALGVRELRRFFLWTQGQFQALLPHEIMVCLQFGADARLLRVECLHGRMLDAELRRRLVHAVHGLAPRLARFARSTSRLPLRLDAGAADAAGRDGPGGDAAQALAGFRAELRALGLDNALLHGSEGLAGFGSCFILFGLPHKPGPRQAYFMELVLPYLHMALLGLAMDAESAEEGAPAGNGIPLGAAATARLARPVSAREAEVLYWLREGKSNDEIAQLLGISALTVKNHLQRVYRLLGVSNRAHATARCATLRLLERHPPPRAA